MSNSPLVILKALCQGSFVVMILHDVQLGVNTLQSVHAPAHQSLSARGQRQDLQHHQRQDGA
jgi:hypothetical protein